jgi:hypothetical protein
MSATLIKEAGPHALIIVQNNTDVVFSAVVPSPDEVDPVGMQGFSEWADSVGLVLPRWAWLPLTGTLDECVGYAVREGFTLDYFVAPVGGGDA